MEERGNGAQFRKGFSDTLIGNRSGKRGKVIAIDWENLGRSIEKGEEDFGGRRKNAALVWGECPLDVYGD